METYRNSGGDSGIVAYEIGVDSITVQFATGAVYLYTYASAGSFSIEEMKSLAKTGNGLNSYIMRNVRTNYASKLS